MISNRGRFLWILALSYVPYRSIEYWRNRTIFVNRCQEVSEDVLFERMKQQIEAVLEDIRPRLALHGGNVEYVDFDEASGTLSLRMQGACKGCPMAQLTLKAGIETFVCAQISKVLEVVEVQ